MAARFTDRELESFAINPRRPTGWARCPFCGGQLVMGFRKDTGNLSLAHDAFADPTRPGEMIAGCDVFRDVCTRNAVEFLRLLQSKGVSWEKLVG